MPADDSGTLKLIKGGASGSGPGGGGAAGFGSGAAGAATRTVRRRSATRRRVTRRTPGLDPVAAILERLDEEPVDLAVEAVDEDGDSEVIEPPAKPDPERAPDRPKDGRTTPRRRKVGRARQPHPGRPARPASRPRPTSRLRPPGRATAALLALLCLALAAAAVVGSRWYGDRQLERAHQQAMAAAKQTTVDFVSVSAASVDRDLQRIVAGSTGDFKEEFTRGQSQVRAAIVENNVESRGTVLRAALLSGDRRRAVVLIAMDATVRNAKAPDGRVSHYRIQVEVDRDPDAGRWLVSRLQFVG
jgi:Mce-associated membrane protein